MKKNLESFTIGFVMTWIVITGLLSLLNINIIDLNTFPKSWLYIIYSIPIIVGIIFVYLLKDDK